MHSCLQIEEVLLRIFSELDNKSLAVLARTCRTLSNPALDVLYDTAKLDNLVKCLPSDLWSVRPLIPDVGSFTNSITISRPPNKDDWAALAKYSTRVRRLTVCDGWTGTEAMDMVSSSPAHIDLFPRLRCILMCFYETEEVTTSEDFAAAARFLRWACRPAISTMRLTLPAAVLETLWDELSPLGLGRACPDLLDLSVSPLIPSGLPDRQGIQPVENIICSLPSLQSLSTASVVSGVTLQHAATWTDLHTLYTYLPPYPHLLASSSVLFNVLLAFFRAGLNAEVRS